MQNCICFTNPCINFLVLLCTTCKYHPKVFELLDMLQEIAAYLQYAVPWVSGETQLPWSL